MMKTIAFFFSVLITTISFAQKPADTPVWLALQKLEQDAGLLNGTLAVKAVNLSNGDVIIDHNSQRAMVPASIQKLLTTAAALETLGANYQFETKLMAEGDIEGGVIYGDVYVMPSGDPTIQSRYFMGETSSLDVMENALKKFEGFEGKLVLDASLYAPHATPRGWIWEDMGNYFGATPTPLMWNDNTLEMYLNSGQVGTRAMLSSKTKNVEGFDVDIQVKASSENRDNAWFFSAPNTDKIYATGTIPAHQTNYLVKASHPIPMQQFCIDLKQRLAWSETEFRIDHDYIKHPNVETVETLLSPPLYSIVRMTNENSINLYAEALALALDPAERFRSIEGGVEGIHQFLKEKRINQKGLVLKDGSGLSPLNRVTCETMIELLMQMQRADTKLEFENSLAVAGKSGTLRGSFGSLTDKMKAKSGTMAGVRNYAGYLANTNGDKIAFCVMINDYDEKHTSTIKQKLEELLLEITQE